MKKELVYDVHTDMMSMPPEGLKEYSVLIVAYPFRKTKTSDFFDANIRTFAQRSPMFCTFRTAVSLSHSQQKKFLKISYISYTTASDVLYLLMVSGEG